MKVCVFKFTKSSDLRFIFANFTTALQSLKFTLNNMCILYPRMADISYLYCSSLCFYNNTILWRLTDIKCLKINPLNRFDHWQRDRFSRFHYTIFTRRKKIMEQYFEVLKKTNYFRPCLSMIFIVHKRVEYIFGPEELFWNFQNYLFIYFFLINLCNFVMTKLMFFLINIQVQFFLSKL